MSNTNLTEQWWETIVGSEIISKKYYHDGENFNKFIHRLESTFSPSIQIAMRNALCRADFFPAGRSLYGAGSKNLFKASMSNCYILPVVEDNIESIFDIAGQMARIFSYGGGCGLNISKLRPRDAKVNNSAKTSTGAVSFMSIFDSIGGVIGSNNRRSALMIGLDCSHPDLEEFLNVKQNNETIQSANTSILFTNEFMEAVKDDREYELYFKVENSGEEIRKKIRARDFFYKFAENNSEYAEPGSIFIDTVRSNHLLSGYPKELYNIDISNPCSEYFGSANNSCNLGSINLYNIVQKPFTTGAFIDWDELARLTKLGIIALDEILDYGYDMQPLQANKDCIDDYRPIGLGVFGLADMLIAMNVEYGSNVSAQIAESITEFMMDIALGTSCDLAKEKGTFGKYKWKYIKESPFIKRLSGTALYEDIKKYGLRNGSLLSIAPTGSIGTMAGMSGGVEPLFSISYERTTHALEKEGKFFKVFSKSVEHLLKHHNINPETISDDEIMERFPFVTVSHNINPLDRIKVQSAMQKNVDNAISSTINMKNSATVQDVFDTYILAWESGCKGITIFRNGCKRSAIMKTGKEEPAEVKIVEKAFEYNSISPVKIGDVASRKIIKHTSCVRKLVIFVCNDGENIVEVYTNIVEGCTSNIATITRQASLALRSGIIVEEVCKSLTKSTCKACIDRRNEGKTHISRSCGSAIGEAIMEEYNRLKGEKVIKQETVCTEETGCTTCKTPCKEIVPTLVKKVEREKVELLPCPRCGKLTFRPEAKCGQCLNCNYSSCEHEGD